MLLLLWLLDARCWSLVVVCQMVRDGVPRGKSRDGGTLISLFLDDEFIRHLLAEL